MNSVTVVAITGVSPTSHARAVDRTAKCLVFPATKMLISNSPPKYRFDGRVIPLPEWAPSGTWDRWIQSRLFLKYLPTCAETDFCLTCQWDGFAINPRLWTDDFFKYDYIGAPWPMVWNKDHPERRVGCGGFTLRSRKWLQACLSLADSETSAEDVHCCCHHLDHFLSAGCVVAPLEVAYRFCLEHGNPEFPNHTINDSFAFHWRGHFGERHDLIEPPVE